MVVVLVLTLSVLLRQNPHNVHEWLKRVKLFEGKPREVSTGVVINWSVHIGTVTPTLAVHPSPSHTLTLPHPHPPSLLDHQHVHRGCADGGN